MHPLETYLKQNHKTHIIFDFDATLFLLVLPWSKWVSDVKEKLAAYDSSVWDSYHQKQINLAELQNHYMKHHGETIREFLRTYSQDFEENMLEAVEHNHDLLSVLRNMDDSVKKYIWSSNSRKTIDAVLQETNLHNTFSGIITRDDVKYLKPDSEGFQHIYDPRFSKSQYLLIGDSSSDRGAAASAGIDFYHTDTFDQGL